MTESDERLRRSYERLLWAYPRWYRRERGTEILTTLLDAAPPGRRRPSLADALDLVGRGLRRRLAPPRTPLNRLVAATAATFSAFLGIAAVAPLTSFPGPPAEDRAAAIAATAMGQAPRNLPAPAVRCSAGPSCEPWNGRDDVVSYDGSPDAGIAQVEVFYNPPADETPARLAQARERLAAAGWRVSPVTSEFPGVNGFTAVRDGLTFAATGYTSAAGGFRQLDPEWLLSQPDAENWPSPMASVVLRVTKNFSAWMYVAALAGAATGLLTGWLVATWALHRYRRHRLGTRLAMVVAALPALAGTAVLTTLTALFTVLVAVDDPSPRHILLPAELLPGDLLPVESPLTALVVVSWLTAVAVAGLPVRAAAEGTAVDVTSAARSASD